MSSIVNEKQKPQKGPLHEYKTRIELRQVLRDQLGHLEHGYGGLAAKDLFELVIGVNVALVLLVLKTVLLYIFPDLLCNLGAGHRTLSNDGGEVDVNIEGLHES